MYLTKVEKIVMAFYLNERPGEARLALARILRRR